MPKNYDRTPPRGSKKFIETTDTLTDLMTEEVMGIDPANKAMIDNDEEIGRLNNIIKAIENKYSTDYESVDDKVLSIKTVDGNRSVEDEVNNLLEMNKMQYAFNSVEHRNIVKAMRENNFVCENMPQAMKAVIKVAKMVLSPNRQTGVSINITDFTISKMRDAKSATDYKTFEDAEKVRDFLNNKYKINKLVLGAVTDAFKQGYKFILTIPNKDIAKDLLALGAIKDSDIGNKNVITKTRTIREKMNNMDKWQAGNALFMESVVSPLADKDGKIPAEALNAFSELVPVSPYTSDALNTALHSIMKAKDDGASKGLRMFGEKSRFGSVKNTPDMIRGGLYGSGAFDEKIDLMNESAEQDLSEDELFKLYKENMFDVTGVMSGDPNVGFANKANKNEKKFNKRLDNIKGCYTKSLEPEKCVPIKVNDQLIGVYYLESSPMANSAVRGHITPMISRPNGEDTRVLQKNLVETAVRFIRTELSEKFIDVNQNVLGHIYELMTSHINIGAAFKVRFFPARYIHDFSNYQLHPTIPNSLLTLANPLAKEWILLDRNHIMNRLYNEKDRIVQYYNASKSPDIKKLAKASMSIMQRLYPNLVQLMDMGFITQSTTDSYVLVSPMNNNGEKIINYERLEGQKPTDENERLDKLEEQVTTMIGYTYSLGASARKEFMSATEVVGMDAEKTGEVMDAQSQYAQPIDDLCRFLVESELANDESIVEFKTKLERPSSFDDEVNLATVQKTVDVGTKLAETLISEDEARKPAISTEFVKLYLKDSIDPKFFSYLEKAERIVQQQGKAEGAATDELDLGDNLEF